MRFATRYAHHLPPQLMSTLGGMGISSVAQQEVVRLIIEFNRLGLDSYEQSLMAAICATSADRGVTDKFDYAVLSATQVKEITLVRIDLVQIRRNQ